MYKKTNKKPQVISTPIGNLSYKLTRSSGRRTMMIRIEDTEEVHVFAPFYANVKDIQAFLYEKAGWIQRKLQETAAYNDRLKAKTYDDGQEFLFLGKKFPLEIVEEKVSRTLLNFDGFRWVVRIALGLSPQERSDQVKKGLIRWYRAQAEEILGGRIFHFARNMNVKPKKIAVRTQKRIWGSCDHRDQVIHLNWQIILAPLNVIDYIVVHELCHLRVPNHSKRFWQEVEKVLPSYRKCQDWLKLNDFDMTLP